MLCLLQPQFKDDDASALPLYDDLEGYSSDTPDEEDIENDSEEEEDEDIVGKVHAAFFTVISRESL
jgi:hypothetical protein